MALILFAIKVLTICVGLLYLVVCCLRKWNFYKAAIRLPGPKALPIIGNGHSFIGNSADILNKIIELCNSYPSPFRIWLGTRLFVVVYEPEDVKTVLLSSKAIEKEEVYKFLIPFVGTGIFTASAPKWRNRRKLIMPAFNLKILESFVKIFAKQSLQMANKMENEMGKEFNISDYVAVCTLNTIRETMMGLSLNKQDSEFQYVMASKRIMEIIYSRVFKIWLHPDMIFYRTSLGKELREKTIYTHSITNDVIQTKRSTMKLDSLQQTNHGNLENEKLKKTFLDLLLELTDKKAKFTDEDIREEVDTMLVAGSDTTASVLAFVILMLANFPKVQDKVYEELYSIFGSSDPKEEPVKSEDLRRMEYLERVIKETLRIFPITPVIARTVTEDLKTGNYILPKGCSVAIGLFKIHRSEKYWPDPLEFNPDRFLPENVAKRHPYCFIPFSGGPRNCIGGQYAIMAMKTLLATILRKFVLRKVGKFEKIEEIEIQADMILKTTKPLKIRVEKRNRI